MFALIKALVAWTCTCRVKVCSRWIVVYLFLREAPSLFFPKEASNTVLLMFLSYYSRSPICMGLVLDPSDTLPCLLSQSSIHQLSFSVNKLSSCWGVLLPCKTQNERQYDSLSDSRAANFFCAANLSACNIWCKIPFGMFNLTCSLSSEYGVVC